MRMNRKRGYLGRRNAERAPQEYTEYTEIRVMDLDLSWPALKKA
jgi:hypothetical protein